MYKGLARANDIVYPCTRIKTKPKVDQVREPGGAEFPTYVFWGVPVLALCLVLAIVGAIIYKFRYKVKGVCERCKHKLIAKI